MITDVQYQRLMQAIREGFDVVAKTISKNGKDHDTLVEIKTLVKQQAEVFERHCDEDTERLAIFKQSADKAHCRIDRFQEEIVKTKEDLNSRIDRVLVAGGLSFLGLCIVIVGWLVFKIMRGA